MNSIVDSKTCRTSSCWSQTANRAPALPGFDYVRIARPDHWFKNVFVLPGILLGWLACPPHHPLSALVQVGLSLMATCLICSSNYTINELLDAKEDRHHPDKRSRPAAAGRIHEPYAWMQWALLAAAGLAIGWRINLPFFLVALTLLVMGLVYNVPPLRSKDRAYLDVLSESVNNPLRLLLGWYGVGCLLVPPVSLLLSYWMLGAFFMATKRFAELRHINDAKTAAAYRKSFRHYTPERLLIAKIFYATAFGLFTGVFLFRYRIELIFAIPFLSGLMAMYMHLSFLSNSPVQCPESLFKNRMFVVYGLLVTVVIIGCLVVRVPVLDRVFDTTLPHGFQPATDLRQAQVSTEGGGQQQ